MHRETDLNIDWDVVVVLNWLDELVRLVPRTD